MVPFGAFLRPISTPLTQTTMPSSAQVFSQDHSGRSDVRVKDLRKNADSGCRPELTGSSVVAAAREPRPSGAVPVGQGCLTVRQSAAGAVLEYEYCQPLDSRGMIELTELDAAAAPLEGVMTTAPIAVSTAARMKVRAREGRRREGERGEGCVLLILRGGGRRSAASACNGRRVSVSASSVYVAPQGYAVPSQSSLTVRTVFSIDERDDAPNTIDSTAAWS